MSFTFNNATSFKLWTTVNWDHREFKVVFMPLSSGQAPVTST